MRVGWSMFACAVFVSAAAGCTAAQDAPVAEVTLAEPNVVMEADPPPPFTYWAPEGATIRNHPRVPGVWIAQADGEADRIYFGDECRASRYQRFVGQPLDRLPEKPDDAVWRTACSTCAVTSDLGMERMNIAFDEETRVIGSISCG